MKRRKKRFFYMLVENGWGVHTNEAAQKDTQERDGGLSVAQTRRP